MDLLVLDKKFEAIGILDVYTSIIWTDRYNECGDFEIECKPTAEIIEYCQLGNYILSNISDRAMIIEELEINTDLELGNTLKITGRSLESVLYRRIIWEQTTLNGKVDGQIEKLIREAITAPSDAKRKIPNFKYKPTTDTRIQAMTIEQQFTGDYLFDAIQKICKRLFLGFRAVLTAYNDIEFGLYCGVDRSYEQIDNPYIVFSTNNANLTNSNHIQSITNHSTIALVAGEGEGASRTTLVVGDTVSSGLDRREMYVDARDLQSDKDEYADNPITPEQYRTNLKNRGQEKLFEARLINAFEGETETLPGYEFGKDFNIGDICQLENEFGMKDRVRIVELIYSENESEIKYYPTFRSVSEELLEDSETTI